MSLPPTDNAVGPHLLAAVARGEPESLDSWYRSEHPVVYRLCFGFLADPTEAEDAAQDAMLKLADTLRHYDPQRPYPAWRNTVVLNLCRDTLRRKNTRLHAEQAAPLKLPPKLPPRPEEMATAGEIRELLHQALAHLSPREREAFVLRDLEGRPTREAAAVLGVGESTVRSLLTLARRRLRQLLGKRLAIEGTSK
ncbi:MAG: RNA polymerase sigma-70 factor (ECF subfamily) [Pseudohongiellaceae bacterium]|jgi:RNA polymerase sigma-70 factor (ECF subfamily)